MNIASAGVLGNWRPDELAHISRYDKIATLCIEEAKRLGRPIDTLEVGCGECWTLRNLYKAHVVKKSDIIKSYAGYDIDPACELENPFWSNAGGLLKESTWFKNFNGEIRIQDLTVNPDFDLEDESIDFFWSTEVIEHMRREFVPLWLDDAARCMRPNAIAYISTPNHDGSNAKLPKDHIYEWGFEELKTEQLDHQEPMVDGIPARANRLFPYAWTSEQMVLLKERFGRHFLRMAAATPYPEYSNNCAWRLVKK